MSYTPYRFRIDIYKNEAYADDSGQLLERWSFSRTVKCTFMPSRGEERLVGRIQNPHSYVLWTDDQDVTYSDQMRNLRDRDGNLIEDARFNVIGIKRFIGWAKVHHIEVNLQAITE